MRKFLVALTLLFCAFGLLVAPPLLAQTAGGQSALEGLNKTGTIAYGAKEAPEIGTLVGNLINALIGLLGIVFLFYLVYGGVLYMNARGDEKQVGHAKQTMLNAAVGLVIIVTSYAISTFVIDRLVESQNPVSQSSNQYFPSQNSNISPPP